MRAAGLKGRKFLQDKHERQKRHHPANTGERGQSLLGVGAAFRQEFVPSTDCLELAQLEHLIQ